MTAKEYAQLLNTAKGIAYNITEAQDLLQEALVVAIKENRLEFSLKSNQRWIAGVLRNKALQASRTISRRKKRHDAFRSDHALDSQCDTKEEVETQNDTLNTFLNELPPSARKIAILVMHGLNRPEICSLLSLSSAAFRQRLTSIRKALGPLPSPLKEEVMALAYASRKIRDKRGGSLPVGLIRKALLKSLLNDDGRTLGTHDPSGHLIVVSSAKPKK